VRFDPPAAASPLASVGLFTAMRHDVLMALYGLHAEHGSLLRASAPVTGVACRDAQGRLSFEASWRFTPPPPPKRGP
jgi:hypothetical protein